MAFPATSRTHDINNISSVVWREILPTQYNLITENEDKLFQVARQRGAIEAVMGGDKFDVNALASTGETEKEYDPAAVNPSTTVGQTAYQYLQPAEYKYYARTKNINVPQDLPKMTRSARAVADIFRSVYMGNMMGMIENLVNGSTSPGGFWNATTVTQGIANAFTLFADKTSALFGISQATEATQFQPSLVAGTTSGSALIDTDLQKLINTCDRGGEGGITDMFTSQAVWEKIRAQLIAEGIIAIPTMSVDSGLMNTIPFAGRPIHWTRHLSASTSWDLDGYTNSATPIVGIDFNSVRYRVNVASALPGDPFGFFNRENDWEMSETLIKRFQRITHVGQWYFRTSRRTSGCLHGLEIT